MLDSLRIEDIDQLLNELEQLAHSAPSREQFLSAALERLKYLLHADGTAVFVRAAKEQWLPIAHRGEFSSDPLSMLLGLAEEQVAYLQSADQRQLAVPIRKSQWHRGALVVELAHSPSAMVLQELLKLCNAFAEIVALHQWSELELLLDQKWLSFQSSLAVMATASSLEEGACSLVNDLASLALADRVSLVQSARTTRALAISGVVKPEKKGGAVVAIEQLCVEAMQDCRPLARHAQLNTATGAQTPQPNENLPLLANYVCIPFVQRARQPTPTADTAVLLEWSEYESFVYGCTTLNYMFPSMQANWLQLERWLKIPRAVRALFGRRRPAVPRSVGMARRWILVAGMLAAIVWGLTRPIALRIEATGTLQPIEQRAVFAALDGVVERIFVVDGQPVAAGEPLIAMRSPMLEIDIQEVLGEMRANAEKRDGLNVVINQMTRENTDYSLQSKLSSQIRELETELETLQKKQIALEAEKQKLVIASPIEGFVIARQIQRFLNARPVRRGDPLLRVVNLDGPWRVELLVADQDSGHLKRKLFESGDATSGVVPDGNPQHFEFVIASQPDEKFDARATWVSESARNPRGEGMFIDLFADVDQEISARGHMGATVYAYFDCGRRPFWFVWSRPLIESIQRKLWF